MLPEDTTIHFHTHETAGIGIAAYQAALEGGADAIDLSMAPCSGGTCQPDIITMWHALRGTKFDLDVDIDKVRKAEDVFKQCMQSYFLPPEATKVEPIIPWSPMPGGALTANTQMLRDNGIMDKYPEIIRAMGEVVRCGGFGTSVTPVSQFYFQQALNNVMFGEWKKIAEPYGRMILGYFGKTPIFPDPEIVKLAKEQLGIEATEQTPIERNDADPTKGIEAARRTLKENNLDDSEENIFIVATCRDKGIKFLKGEAKPGIRKIKDPDPAQAKEIVDKKPSDYQVTVNSKKYALTVDDNKVTVDGKTYVVGIASTGKQAAMEAADDKLPAPSGNGESVPLLSKMPGQVITVLFSSGDHIEEGEAILIIEAMKMEIKITAPKTGVLREVNVKKGDQIGTGDTLAIIE
jgi:pyruvate carboxylase subunit B